MTTIYKKVYLNNDVNNLPKIEDEYYVMTKEDGMNIFNWYGANFSNNWLTEVNWYLQPIELPSEAINHLRVLMEIINRRIEEDIQMNVSDLKVLWNNISDVVTELEENGY